MAKIDDFLLKKKETAPILDLSKATANTKDEFKRLFEKVPDFKIKPEKPKIEDIKIKEKKIKFKTGKKDLKLLKEPYAFMNPLPVEMKNLNINDLVDVPIDWKMLTTTRPKSKVEEEMFSRLVELGKLQVKTAASDKRGLALDPQIRKIKNKTGIVELRVVSCPECGEDFCNGKVCGLFTYDEYGRTSELSVKIQEKVQPTESTKKRKKKIKIKIAKIGKSKRKSEKPKSKKQIEKTKPKSPKKVLKK